MWTLIQVKRQSNHWRKGSMQEFRNEFSWSKSREEMFRGCQRQYYYHYYASWGGWKRHSDEKTRRIYTLKKMTNQHLWAGEHVHRAIDEMLKKLKTQVPLDPEDQVVEQVLEKMRNEYRNSVSGKKWENPQSCGLMEHEYNWELSKETWKKMAHHVETCLRNFYQSNIFKQIQQIPTEQWLEVEELSHFLLNETKVYLSVDFAIKRGEDVVIYDWKTGHSRNQEIDLQMSCYGWFAWQKWNVDPKRIELIEVHLADLQEEHHHVQGINLEKVQKRIFDSIQSMQFLLDDIQNNRATEERFVFTENERFCGYCNFQKICTKWTEDTKPKVP